MLIHPDGALTRIAPHALLHREQLENALLLRDFLHHALAHRNAILLSALLHHASTENAWPLLALLHHTLFYHALSVLPQLHYFLPPLPVYLFLLFVTVVITHSQVLGFLD